jgi:hypothetical protein
MTGIVSISGKALVQEVGPVENGCHHNWMTKHKAKWLNQEDEYDELEEDEAVCVECGETSTVNDESEEKNIILDKAGAEQIADYITNGTGNIFNRMKIGSTATVTSPTEDNTQLSNTVATSPSLTPTQQSTGGAQKKVVWSHTFPSSTGRSSVVSLGMDTQTATGTNAFLLNRVTFSAKDNANNDLALTYELTVS